MNRALASEFFSINPLTLVTTLCGGPEASASSSALKSLRLARYTDS
jgi:hypothetical protein